MESTEAKPKKGEEKLDGIVTETYDKSLHLKKDAPVLLSPGERNALQFTTKRRVAKIDIVFREGAESLLSF